jgi:hypothetical protein
MFIFITGVGIFFMAKAGCLGSTSSSDSSSFILIFSENVEQVKRK